MLSSDKKIKNQQFIQMYIKFPLIVFSALGLLAVLIYLLAVRGYVIEVNPAQATPVTLRVDSGMGIFIDDQFYTLSPHSQISASAERYLTQTAQIDPQSPNTITLTLPPMPAQVKITTEPEFAQLTWYLNDQLSTVAPEFQQSLLPGEYRIKGISPYHQAFEQQLVLQAADEVEQVLELQPINGQLSLNTTPSGANVKINGRAQGVTPLNMPLLGGQYTIRVEAEGYQVVTDRLEVSTVEMEPVRDYRLTPLQATLAANLQPKQGLLLIDGQPRQLPASIDANRSYQIRYEKIGYYPYQTKISLGPDQRKTLDINLKVKMGKVQFDANVAAEVVIDGQVMGQTPLTLELPVIEQSVTLRRAGYRAVSRIIQASTAKMAVVKVELLTEFAARRAEGIPLVASQLGIDLIRIAAQTEPFVLGSKPNTPYRQRHEHPVKVLLERPFWFASKEITQDQFGRFKAIKGNGDLPVTGVTWEDAIAFCNWLSVQEGLPVFYDVLSGTVNQGSNGYRLPTEAEWEFIASQHLRYGKTKYIWGDTDKIPENQGNFADKSLTGKQTFVLAEYTDQYPGKASVGRFKVRYGVYDMDGNVSEWVHDQYNVVPPDLSVLYRDYLGSTVGVGHVVKGGSFQTGRPQELRNAYRQQQLVAADDIGFRIARYDQPHREQP